MTQPKYPNRLKEIRTQRGLSHDKLAGKLNTSRGQVYQLENGLRKLTHDWMVRLARALDCTPEELIRSARIPIVGTIGAGGNVFPFDDVPLLQRGVPGSEQDYINCEFVDAPPGAPSDIVALRVSGNSMLPFLPPGTIVYYSERFTGGAPDDCIAKHCVVQTRDGATMLKLVRRSHLHGRCDLISYNLETMRDVELAWCAPVLFIKPL